MTQAEKHVVVDGSNIATEGRTFPSLAQLESAVEEIQRELRDTEVTVVVDATFAHRIDPNELSRFEAAQLRGEYVSPPAGAIGRGDAFLLRIAEKVGATVLSNDSFQEFHGEHQWLFEPGRLLGATPVPGIGWIFVPRNPVRGPKSRVAVREATRAKSRVVEAVAVATAEATGDDEAATHPRRRGGRRSRVDQGDSTPAAPAEQSTPARRPEAVNAPIPFITFIADHPLGASVEGLVDSFTSHGAVILVGDVRCYVPLSGLADPAPRSAREVLAKGSRQQFLVTALDPARRGIELALPGVGVVRGVPSEETVAAELAMTRPVRKRAAEAMPVGAAPSGAAETLGTGRPARKVAAKKVAARAEPESPSRTARTPPAKEASAKKIAAKRTAREKSAAASGDTPAKRSSARQAVPEGLTSAKRVAAKKMAGDKVAPEKVLAKRVAAKKVAAKKVAPKKVAARSPTTRTEPSEETTDLRRSPSRPTAAAKKASPARSATRSSTPRTSTALQGATERVTAKETATSGDGPRRSGRARG